MRTSLARAFDGLHSSSQTPSRPVKQNINQSFPAELLATLFEWVVHMKIAEPTDVEVDEEDLFSEPPCLETSDTLSHVCSRWRIIALNAPSIWSHLGIINRTSPNKVQAWLTRSKAVPITLHIGLSVRRRDIFRLLSPHVHRIRDMTCVAHRHLVVRDTLQIFSERTVPLLRRLCLIRDTEEPGEMSLHSMFDGPGSAPSLQHLHLADIPLTWPSGPGSGPYSDLESLELVYIPSGWKPSTEQLIAMLVASPQLKRLVIIGRIIRSSEVHFMSRPDSIPTFGPVTLTSLTCLEVEDFDHPTILNYHLRLLDAPNLQSLSIRSMNLDPFGRRLDFRETLQLLADGKGPSGSLERIKSLELKYCNCSSLQTLLDLFGALSDLRHLDFRVNMKMLVQNGRPTDDRGALTHHYLMALLPAQSQDDDNSFVRESWACPRLSTVCLHGFDRDVLAEVIRSRHGMVRSVRLDKASRMEDTVGEWKRMGIDVDYVSMEDV